MKLPALVQRNPGMGGKYPAGTKATATALISENVHYDRSRDYRVILSSGEVAVWNDEFFHEIEPRPLQDVVKNVEDSNVTASRGLGMKFDGDKVRAELLLQGMPRTLEGVAEILTFGARKYAAHSWQQVEDGINRYEAAAMRHKLARMKGEEFDRESGQRHILHELCSLMFVAELQALAKEKAGGAE